jgi:hypothetical protein
MHLCIPDRHTVSLAAWLIPDTTLSLWSGFWQNAVLNVVLAILFAPQPTPRSARRTFALENQLRR